MFIIFKKILYDWVQYYEEKWKIDLTYFLKNGFWMFLRQFFEIIAGLALFIALARLTSAETLGSFQYVLSFFAVISFLSIPGLNVSLLRSISKGYEGEYYSSVKSSFSWSLIGVPIIFIFGGYYFIQGNQSLGTIIMISSVFFPFFYAPNTWNQLLQGKDRYKKLASYGIYHSLINVVATIGAIYFWRNNALVILLTYLATYSFLHVIYFIKSMRLLENSKTSGDTMSYGWFLTKINVLHYAAENIDRFIIGFMMSPAMLAVFTVVSTIPFKFKTVIKSIVSVFFSRMSQDNFRALSLIKEKKTFVALSLMLIFTFVCGLIFFLAIEPISRILFGNEYAQYYHYGKQFSILIILYPPLLLSGWYIQAKKMSKSLVYINIISLSVKIMSLIIAAGFWGIMGAIWSYNANVMFLLGMQVVAIFIEDNKKVLTTTENYKG